MRTTLMVLTIAVVAFLTGCRSTQEVTPGEIDAYDCVECDDVKYVVAGSKAPWHHRKQMVKQVARRKVETGKEIAFDCDHCADIEIREAPVVDPPN